MKKQIRGVIAFHIFYLYKFISIIHIFAVSFNLPKIFTLRLHFNLE